MKGNGNLGYPMGKVELIYNPVCIMRALFNQAMLNVAMDLQSFQRAAFTGEIFKTLSYKGKPHILMLMKISFTEVNGVMISHQGRAQRSLAMAITMKGSFLMDTNTEKESLFGETVWFIMGILS